MTEEELEKIIFDTWKKLDKLRDEKAQVELLPYVGRCFRKRNCYSCPESDKDYWWTYYRVLRIDGRSFISLTFEKTAKSEFFVKSQCEYFDNRSDGEEISVVEFDNLWHKFLTELTNL